ncbi:HNH endonuclease [Gordonia phage RedWattleHog]|uniref:HNH endonuclease n=1 Tax=Gordonia phage Stormageddon TaxID=2656541 RepID=A0A649VSH7_9CAUD|nr:HNH endonuclease [Gordonia phage Stormageddon]QGJ94945.1 HNH endonuclease [Gordonia phage Stormageddon]QLF83589.1 HNH endonuclease [Gordonia phage RedWattleHog]
MATEGDWTPVPGFPGYEASAELGRVRSLDRLDARGHRRKGVVLKGTQQVRKGAGGRLRMGPLMVSLSKDGRSRPYLVHRIILLTFVGPCPEGMEGLHHNGDATDNRLVNLRWGTSVENKADMVRLGENFNANKERCPRGHLLRTPNLVRGPGRACLSCARARAYLHYYPERSGDLQAESDRRYAELELEVGADER